MTAAYRILWHDFPKHLTENLSGLPEDQLKTNCTIIVSGDNKFKCHREVLSESSLLFERSLADLDNVPDPYFFFLDIEPGVMKNLLHLVYFGEVTISLEDMKDFCRVATALEMRAFIEQNYEDDDDEKEYPRSKKRKIEDDGNPIAPDSDINANTSIVDKSVEADQPSVPDTPTAPPAAEESSAADSSSTIKETQETQETQELEETTSSEVQPVPEQPVEISLNVTAKRISDSDDHEISDTDVTVRNKLNLTLSPPGKMKTRRASRRSLPERIIGKTPKNAILSSRKNRNYSASDMSKALEMLYNNEGTVNEIGWLCGIPTRTLYDRFKKYKKERARVVIF